MSTRRTQRKDRTTGGFQTRRQAGPRPLPKPGSRRAERPSRLELIGRDVSQPPRRRRARCIAPILAAALASALFLVILRTEVLRLRYALASAVAEEQRLLEQTRSLTATMRKLRDPGRLAQRARELGFEHPAHLIRVDAPLPPPDATRTGTALDARP